MPFKSQAQRGLFYAKAARGEMPEATVQRWEEETKRKKLPEYVDAEAKRMALRKLTGKR